LVSTWIIDHHVEEQRRLCIQIVQFCGALHAWDPRWFVNVPGVCLPAIAWAPVNWANFRTARWPYGFADHVYILRVLYCYNYSCSKLQLFPSLTQVDDKYVVWASFVNVTLHLKITVFVPRWTSAASIIWMSASFWDKTPLVPISSLQQQNLSSVTDLLAESVLVWMILRHRCNDGLHAAHNPNAALRTTS